TFMSKGEETRIVARSSGKIVVAEATTGETIIVPVTSAAYRRRISVSPSDSDAARLRQYHLGDVTVAESWGGRSRSIGAYDVLRMPTCSWTAATPGRAIAVRI